MVTIIFDEIQLSSFHEEVLMYLAENGPQTREDLVQKFHKPRTTIYDNIRLLIKLGLIKRYQVISHGKGRPKVYFGRVDHPSTNRTTWIKS